MLHTCQLEVQWEREGAVENSLQLRLTLDGAKEPYNFLTLICGEGGMYMERMLLHVQTIQVSFSKNVEEGHFKTTETRCRQGSVKARQGIQRLHE